MVAGRSERRGRSLHHAYQQDTTMTFLEWSWARSEQPSPRVPNAPRWRSIGVFSNRLLLWGILFELVSRPLIIYAPPLQSVLGTAALEPHMPLFMPPFPFIVWGADELARWLLRRRQTGEVPE